MFKTRRILETAITLIAAGQMMMPALAEDPRGFGDHPALRYEGRRATPRFNSEYLRGYREQYAYSTKNKTIDCAGRFIVVKLPCGSSCVQPTFLDVKTGRIVIAPTVSGWREVSDDFEPVKTHANSRLVVFSGRINEAGVNGIHKFVISDRGTLRLIESIDLGGNFSAVPKSN